MSPRKRSLDFKGELSRSNAGAVVTPFYFKRMTYLGEVMEFDLRALPGTSLAHDLAGAWQALWAGERCYARLNCQHQVKTKELVAFACSLHDQGITTIEQIRGTHVDAVEADIFARRAASSAFGFLAYITRTLKLLPVERLSPDLLVRLQYLSERVHPQSMPRDSYSEHIADQLRAACRARITEVIQRLTVDADALVASGHDPRADALSKHWDARRRGCSVGWKVAANLAWEMDRTGPMSVARWQECSGYVLRRANLTAVRKALYPMAVDLVPFYLLLVLETGLPPSGASDLEVDCLLNARRGLVDLAYYKARAGRSILESVRDGSAFTPGGIIRAVLSITRRLRAHSPGPDGCPSRMLWLKMNIRSGRGQPERFRLLGASSQCLRGTPDAVAAFIQQARIVDDDGKPMRVIQPARLRKTHKEMWYRRTHGQLEELAYDHSPQVAATHYGNIPALRTTHEQTIEEGLQDALAVGRSAVITVITPKDEARIVAGDEKVARRLRKPLVVLQRVTQSAEQDVMLAACLNFYDSPFGKPGEPCPVATWRCLACPNAVVNVRKLPELITLLNRALAERALMGEELWRLTFGEACERIEHDILPRFPQAVLVEARAIAASGNAMPWLPPELFAVPTPNAESCAER